ncbi:60S ribosomal protein L22 [Zancudomyces culisetae]|uniref:60S ribosomal protein L22 n=1 Tax=Zancudomyces culisetae TaxID=1213189 RepID=A0A1R1PS70_ZANCU|nr:60S ribosomal protein L22 [Zancudomyces culisetae]OMH84956.1 60S ribosomal protein L22 [Zancudomyces culisetae]|eukprot:OMH83769.1 60S ribosomal protein L22 [Zancudomyces culisetae]
MTRVKSKTQPRKLWPRYKINVSVPAGDKILDVSSFEKFLHDRIKINGVAGKLGNTIVIKRQGNSVIDITSKIDLSKRYVKYLTKKFLKKNMLRDWLRVVSTDKNTYKLKYYNINKDQIA